MRRSLRGVLLGLALAAPALEAQTVRAGNGTAAAPSITFNACLSCGLYRDANGVNVSVGGAVQLHVRASEIRYYDHLVSGGSGAQFQSNDGTAALPTYTFGADPNTGLYRFGADSLGWAAAGRHALVVRDSQLLAVFGRAGQPTYSFLGDDDTGIYRAAADFLSFATGGSLRAYVANAEAFFGVPIIVNPGSAGAPTYSFSGDPNTGFYRFGTDTVGVAAGGVAAAQFTSAGTFLIGGNGTASAPAYSFNSTNSRNTGFWLSGTDEIAVSTNGTSRWLFRPAGDLFPNATNSYDIGADANRVKRLYLADTLHTTGKVRATALTAAAGTPNTVCINAATKEITENAATDCTVSSRRFKSNIQWLSPRVATHTTMALKGASFTMKEGGRRTLGFIAEQVDSVDHRLAFRDAHGRVNSIDSNGILAALLVTVQEQQRRIDSLTVVVTNLSQRKP